MIRYKIDVLEELKKIGYTTTIIRKKKILAESTLTRLREGKTSISCDSIGVICSMLRCQPSDIIYNSITDAEKIKLFLDNPDPAPAGSSSSGRIRERQDPVAADGSGNGKIFLYFLKLCIDFCTKRV